MIAVETNILVYAHRADSPWLESPELVLLSEFEHYWTALKPTL